VVESPRSCASKAGSTGPRTPAGKAITRRNAFRHGLAASLSHNALLQIDRAALMYIGKSSDPYRVHFGRIAARADYEIDRVRKARRTLIENRMASSNEANKVDLEAQAIIALLPELMRLERYERRAMSRRKKAIECL
jgi:hypothetical protein